MVVGGCLGGGGFFFFFCVGIGYRETRLWIIGPKPLSHKLNEERKVRPLSRGRGGGSEKGRGFLSPSPSSNTQKKKRNFKNSVLILCEFPFEWQYFFVTEQLPQRRGSVVPAAAAAAARAPAPGLAPSRAGSPRPVCARRERERVGARPGPAARGAGGPEVRDAGPFGERTSRWRFEAKSGPFFTPLILKKLNFLKKKKKTF